MREAPLLDNRRDGVRSMVGVIAASQPRGFRAVRPRYVVDDRCGRGWEREFFATLSVTVILILLLRYSLRIVALARIYPELPTAGPDES